MNIKECIVNNFKLTQEIVLPKIKIYFSDDIHNKAVLGMDILSLFDFNYMKKDKTFYLHYNDGYIDMLYKKTTNHELDYIDPDLIASLDLDFEY